MSALENASKYQLNRPTSVMLNYRTGRRRIGIEDADLKPLCPLLNNIGLLINYDSNTSVSGYGNIRSKIIEHFLTTPKTISYSYKKITLSLR